MNRPFHAFRAFYGGVEEARIREMGDFMRIFREVFFDEFHRRPLPEEMLAPIQDVVFDHRGTYYAAVPLEFGPGADTLKQRKARYIANVMFALETRGFVKLVSRDTRASKQQVRESPGRMSRLVVKRHWSDLSSFAHDQLEARGSEFADSPDFRVYKFAKGKWPEIALRTVVSAHQEEATFRQSNPDTRPTREIDRGPLSGSSGEIEADEATKRRELIEDHSKDPLDDPHDKTSDASSARDNASEVHYRDDEASYERHDDPDPYDYNDTDFPKRHDEAAQEPDTPLRKPNGGSGGKLDS
jgi:hypothetical protein